MSDEKESGDRKKPLTQKEAEERKSIVLLSDGSYKVEYDVTLTIRRSTDKIKDEKSDFEGYLELSMEYEPKDSDKDKLFFLNFVGEIHMLTINEQKVEFKYENYRLFLDISLFKKGSNLIKILYSCPYNHSGVGLHQFIDPVDKKEYLYTQFEPYDCHRVIPCFDQPDIKATLKLKVIAPKEWIVLGNSYENSISDLKDDSELKSKYNFTEEILNQLIKNHDILNKNYHLYTFQETPRISSYLYALCAGPYYCIENKLEAPTRLRLFMRESLKDCGEPEEIFKVTIAGMKFYENYFGIPFPFGKYDQIFCPEYNMGAMENVGLITHNEFYCWKDKPTQIRRTGFAITILHELAHMWFGNMVTMKWWDDLWLNESFATFISHLCMAKSEDLNKRYTMSWVLFADYKGYAYTMDQMTTTHPVKREVENTDTAETGFDEIVYEKGSSMVKQMYYYIGDEAFSKGLKSYFQEYKWGNTIFDNFINKMIEAAGEKLSNLKELCFNWLQKAGLTEISLDLEVDETTKKIKKFVVKQKPCLEIAPNLQTHIVDFIFIYDFADKSKSKIFQRQTIGPNPETSFDFSNELAPELIYLNYDDWGYMKVIISRNRINTLKEGLSKYDDPLFKCMIYRCLFDQVRDSKISGIEYLDIVLNCLKLEKYEHLIGLLLRNITGVIQMYIPIKYSKIYKKKALDAAKGLLKNLLADIDFNKDIAKRIFLNLPSLTSCENDYIYLLSLLNLDPEILSQEVRFKIVAAIYKSRNMKLEDKKKLLEKECTRDKNSNISNENRLYCEALIPDKESKEKVWHKITKETKSDSLNNMQYLMDGFAPMEQLDIVGDFLKDKFFDVIKEIAKKNEVFYVKSFCETCTPLNFVEDDTYINKMQKLVDELSQDKELSIAQKYVQEELDLMKRKQKAYLLCEEYLKNNK